MMKPHFIWRPYALLLLLALVATGTGGCRKDNDPKPPPDPISQLPAETQEGRGTFGVLINGVPHTPHLAIGGSQGEVHFSYSTYGEGKFVRNLHIIFKRDLYINSDSLIISGIQFILPNNLENSPNPLSVRNFKDSTNFRSTFSLIGSYRTTKFGGVFESQRTDKGSLTITKYDAQKKILSGRFDFESNHPDVGMIKFSHGRFDLILPN